MPGFEVKYESNRIFEKKLNLRKNCFTGTKARKHLDERFQKITKTQVSKKRPRPDANRNLLPPQADVLPLHELLHLID